MARGVISLSKGSVGSVGSGQRKAILNHVKTLATAYKVSGQDTWIQEDYYNSGGYDYRILHSVGSPLLGTGDNKGDTDLWVLLQEHVSGVYIRTMSDFCPAADTYQRQTTTTTNCSFSDTGAYDWWCIVNDYEFIIVIVQGGVYYGIYFGQPLNGFSDSSKLGGRARLSVATSTTGNGIVLSLDRDLTGKVQVGQKVFLVNQTPPGAGSLSGDYTELVTVASVGSSTLTVDGVANQPYQIGSTVGCYPYCLVAAQNVGNFLSDIRCSIHPNGGNGASLQGVGLCYWNSTLEGNMDPDYMNIYRMTRVYLNAGSNQGTFGVPQFILGSALGAQSNGDRMLIDGDSTKAYWVFPSLNNASTFGGGCLAIGPGATV